MRDVDVGSIENIGSLNVTKEGSVRLPYSFVITVIGLSSLSIQDGIW